MKKDYYNTFIAMLKLTGLSIDFSNKIADIICNDDMISPDMPDEYYQDIYKGRLKKVERAIKKTFTQS